MRNFLAFVAFTLLAATSAAAPTTYLATPTGGAYNGGQILAIDDHRPVVLYTFCAPRAYACQRTGATPLADLIVMPDGSLIGATQVGGDHYQYWPGSGQVYRLVLLSNDVRRYEVVYYLNECLPYGQVQSIWPIDANAIGGICAGADGGVRWTLQIDPPVWSAVDWW
jgi:hypothetical protein